jgi:hypothetical protein
MIVDKLPVVTGAVAAPFQARIATQAVRIVGGVPEPRFDFGRQALPVVGEVVTAS